MSEEHNYRVRFVNTATRRVWDVFAYDCTSSDDAAARARDYLARAALAWPEAQLAGLVWDIGEVLDLTEKAEAEWRWHEAHHAGRPPMANCRWCAAEDEDE